MVRRDILLGAVLSALGASAGVINVEKRQAAAPANLTDADILSFALVLEHLEDTFYRGALNNFTREDFTNAGYPSNIYQNIQKIAQDEASHVSFLTTALTAAGATPPSACTYNFAYTGVDSFLATSQILEGVGVSAYLGAAQYISNKDYLTAAASILTAEARHNAIIRTFNGYSGAVAYDTPLTPTAVQSAATPFFVSCPDGSAPPFTPFPAANLTSTNATIGSTIRVSYNGSSTATAPQYCVFLSGLQQAYSTYSNGSCEIPSQNLTRGQAYGVVSSSQTYSDATVVAGPFVLNFDSKNNTASGSSGSSSNAAGSNANTLAVESQGAASKMTTAVSGLAAATLAVGTALLL